MPVLIDTYNVLHTVGVLPPDLAGIDVPGLIRLILAGRYRDQKCILVCDGQPEPGGAAAQPEATIAIRYSGRGRSADDLLGQLIRSSTAPRRLVVVSSDHEVQKAARKRRCTALSSAEFLQHLVSDTRGGRTGDAAPLRPRPGAMSETQVDRWMRVFDLDKDPIDLSMAADAVPDVQPAAEPAAQSPKPVPRTLEPGETVPQHIIAQAEALWSQENHPLPQALPGSTEHEPACDERLADLDMNELMPDDGRTRQAGAEDQ
jgi:predicted RNA-binding protein with PIN domain